MFYLFAMHNRQLNFIDVIINICFHFILFLIKLRHVQSSLAANPKMCKRKVQIRATTLEGQYRHHQPLSCCSIAPSICNLLLPDMRINETVLDIKTDLKLISSCHMDADAK